jgi:hypothetical protein
MKVIGRTAGEVALGLLIWISRPGLVAWIF